MKWINKLFVVCSMTMCISCSSSSDLDKTYNQGINIIPAPQNLQVNQGQFVLNKNTHFYVSSEKAQRVAEFFYQKLRKSTGLSLPFAKTCHDENIISLILDPESTDNKEGYTLKVTEHRVEIRAITSQGLFYGLQTLLQLFPAEVEFDELQQDVNWVAPCVEIHDAPRFEYRGFMLDPCRHFLPVEAVKKQIDVLSLFKVNTMHWHLTDDQGWRIEIKKYPKLTEIGAKRVEGEGAKHEGYYTQEQIKEIVAYAAERFITIIPELEMPGHELAAIAAYPELSCRNSIVSPRIVWGVEDVVMCPGKETMFTFLENVIEEMVTLFPGTYFHIGGDECPKTSWENCSNCQNRITSLGLVDDQKHTAEQYLQSYVVRRMEKVLKKYGKRLIGWDEILEGGLSPEATVMSWRGETGGIEAALQNHDVIMASHGNGMYLDQFQGDSKIEPVSIGGYTSLERTYSYNPIPDTLRTLGKEHFVRGVQCNHWSEYMYTPDILEYRMYPRMLALAEIAWTPQEKKNYHDFERRINNAYVRLDAHHIHYHIPQPEQPYGACNYVAFLDTARLDFTSSRPIKMVYTLDGTEPLPNSKEYTEPLIFTENALIKIRSVLPSGKMSPVRKIKVQKQKLKPSIITESMQSGLLVKKTNGCYLKSSELEESNQWVELNIKKLSELRGLNGGKEYLTKIQPHAAVATGYIYIPADGVYFFSTDNEELWLDNEMLISNEGEVKRFSRHDKSIALSKGFHTMKVVFLGHIIGGWPSWWNDSSIYMRAADDKEFKPVSPEQLFH